MKNRWRQLRGHAMDEMECLIDWTFEAMLRMSRQGFTRLYDEMAPLKNDTDEEMVR